MTNEQATNMLKAKLECLKRETSGTNFDCIRCNCDECSLCYEQGNMGEQKEALVMAIKALEQEPCEDTIDRQAAIEALSTITMYKGSIPFDTAVMRIEQLPSVQPKPKTDVLDKIRAEIESIERYGTVNGHDIWLRTPEEIKKEVLKILDKYKTESEDKE